MSKAHSSKGARRTCLAILREWEDTSSFIDAIIDRRCAKAGLDSRDRAFVQSITLGVIRNLSLLEAWIAEMRKKGKLGSDETHLLWIGLYQILLMRVADHAAVNETVELARPRARGVINAILRRATRERDELTAFAKSLPAAHRYSIPDHLYGRWEEQFGTESATALAIAANQPAKITVRSNPLQGDGLSESDLAAAGATPLADHPGFYSVESLPLDALNGGRCYAQDPSTAAAPLLLDARPGECLLDACAAPGGKTAIIAAALENTGEIVAADISSERAERLAGNLERLGVTNTSVEVADLTAETLPAWATPDRFDRILLDAPCSNTGVLRRRADARWRLMPGFAPHMQKLQLRLARSLLPLLKPGGRFVYSTCSIDPDENRAVVDLLLADDENLSLAEERSLMPDEHRDGAYAAALIKSGS